MRLAIQEGIFRAKDFGEFLDRARTWGLSEVEVWGEGLGGRLEDVKRALREAGVRACSICPGDRGIRGSLLDEDWRTAAADIAEFLRLGAELGGAAVILVPRFRRACFLRLYPSDECFDENKLKFLDRLAPLAKEAENLGATILLEPLNRYEADFLITMGQAAWLCGQIDSPRVRVLADLFHANIEEADIPAALAACAKWTAHVHLADSNRLLPGMGHLDFPPILRALDDSGCAGALCIECSCPGPDQLKAVGDSIAGLRGSARNSAL